MSHAQPPGPPHPQGQPAPPGLPPVAIAPPPKKKRTGLVIALVIIGVVLIALLGSCVAFLGSVGSAIDQAAPPLATSSATALDESSDAAADEPTQEATEDASDEPPNEPTEEPTEEPTTAAPKFQSVTYSGRGDDVVKFKKPVTDPVLVTTVWSGPQDNNTIYALDSDGEEGDLLVNTIGNYRGTTITNKYEGNSVAALKVEGSGSWKVTLKPLSAAKSWDGSGTFSGKSDDVISVAGAFDGLDSLKFKSLKADGNITVYALGESEELVVNDIGNFSGEYAMPSEVSLLHVSSDGQWTMNKS